MTKTVKEKERDKTILSATNIIRYILNIKNIELKHKKRILNEMIWSITEADGLTAEKRTGYKKKITYISKEVKEKRDKGDQSIKGLIHDHVYQRKILVQKLLDNPRNTKSILKKAIACIVTDKEHHRLHKVDKNIDGWKRYQKAKIQVFNTKNGRWKF